jgi:ABC-type multidrug transport system fused ATPase/permease subunit
MITIRKNERQTNESPERLFSRLTHSVERVDSLSAQLVANMTINTNRGWIGVYDSHEMKFKLIEPGEFSNMKFYQIIVDGQIGVEDNTTIIKIKIGLGWITFLQHLFAYLVTTLFLILVINFPTIGNILFLLAWALFVPGLLTYFLKRKILRVENKLQTLLGVG